MRIFLLLLFRHFYLSQKFILLKEFQKIKIIKENYGFFEFYFPHFLQNYSFDLVKNLRCERNNKM